jgi:alpha,alpha-trehalose phosphorylase
MVIPYDEALGVHSQSERFTDHQRWDFESCAEQYPLLLNFPYFDLYRKQVVKQADLVLALFVCGDAFTAEEKARDFEYYEAITVRDSSLSACCQAVMAAETGHIDLAYDYFAEAALMDLEDLEHNTRDGIHIASVAGTWIAAVCGFGGVRDHSGQLSFSPRLPAALTRLKFRLMYRGTSLRVEVEHGHVRYSVVDGQSVQITHYGDEVTVEPDKTLELAIPHLHPRPAPSQPPGRAPAKRRPPPR